MQILSRKSLLLSVLILGLLLSVLPLGAPKAEAKAKYAWKISTNSISATSKQDQKKHVYFTVTNQGTKTFDYYISDHGSNWIETYRNGDNKNASKWMKLKPGKTHTFRVALDSRRSGVGTFTGKLTVIRKQNSKKHNISVKYKVTPKKPKASYPNSNTIDTTVTAGKTNTTNSFKIKNTGDAPLIYQLYTDPKAPWLKYKRGNKDLHKTYKYQVGPGESHTITVILNADGYLEDTNEHTVMKIVTNDGTKLIGATMQVRIPQDSNKLKNQSLTKLNPTNPDPDHWKFRPGNEIEVEFQIRNTGENNWTNSTVKYGIEHIDDINWSPRNTYYVASTKKPSELWIVNLPMTIPEMTTANTYNTSWRMFREVNGNKTYFGETFTQSVKVEPYKYANLGPFKRLRNEQTQDYLYTNNETEVDNAVLAGYTFEGVMGNVSSRPFDNSKEIFRLSKNGYHLYTDNADEVATAKNDGWNHEGSYWVYKENTGNHEMHQIWTYRSSDNRYLITNHAGGEGSYNTFHSDLGYIVANTSTTADIALTTESIDFGTVVEGAELSIPFRIENTGHQNLTGDLSAGGAVNLSQDSFNLGYLGKTEVIATVKAGSAGNKSGTITINSNDSNESTRTINWTANIIAQPSVEQIANIAASEYPIKSTEHANNINKSGQTMSHVQFEVPFHYWHATVDAEVAFINGKTTVHAYFPERLDHDQLYVTNMDTNIDDVYGYNRALTPSFRIEDSSGNTILEDNGGRYFYDKIKVVGPRDNKMGLLGPKQFILIDHYSENGNIQIEKEPRLVM